MKKIDSFRKGRIWLNVFRTDSGDLALTIKKSFPVGNSQWKQTPVLLPGRRDIDNLKSLLEEFQKELGENAGGGGQ